jgi:hypothetical protein
MIMLPGIWIYLYLCNQYIQSHIISATNDSEGDYTVSILWHERLINTHGGGYSNQTYMYVIKLIVTGKWFSSDNLVFYHQ